MCLLFGRFPAKMGRLEPLIFRDGDIQFFLETVCSMEVELTWMAL